MMKTLTCFLLISVINPNIFGQDSTYTTVIRELTDIYRLDQYYRNRIDDIETTYGRDSAEIKALFKTMTQADSTNLIKVEAILSRHGWLGYNDIGSDANSTLFYVIQHSDPQTQRKYLPMMREAVQDRRARANDLALLEDRVALDEGNKQLYGSQLTWSKTLNKLIVMPLDDPDNVDLRRASVGLGTMNEYMLGWELVWDLELYKKEISVFEEEWKKVIAKK